MPKPLIPVNGKPLIQRVVESLNIEGHYIFVVLEEHQREWGLASFLNTIKPTSTIVLIPDKTGGAVNTCLLAESLIDNNNHLIISNCDQICTFNVDGFMSHIDRYDGCTITFEADHPKWSYIQLDMEYFVSQVKEKVPISNIANVGIYGYNKGSDFVRFARQMIQNPDKKTNNEFYIAPVYNEFIDNNMKITSFHCDKMLPCGVPEDLIQTEKILKNC